jgi:flavin reductase (DIM6/NTAB) family NADH-FMN oxidoreductase RutF
MNGCTVNTVMQVTSNPIRVSTTVSKTNLTHDMIKKTGLYTVSVLPISAPVPLIGRFGFRSGRELNKFEGIEYESDANGIPYLKNDSIAFMSCKVINTVDLGTHTLFISDVYDSEVFGEEEPMTYAYYRSVKNGKVPKAAPTYREENNT